MSKVRQKNEERRSLIVDNESAGKMANRRTAFAIIGIVCWFAIFISILIIQSAPSPTSYESSVFDGYPFLLWFLLALPFVAFAVLLACPIEGRVGRRVLLSIGGASLASTELLITIPFLRYFFFSGGDTLSNLGQVKDIFATGHFGVGNVYPAIHIWLAQLWYATGLDPFVLLAFSLQFFVIIFFVSMFLLIREIGFSKPVGFFVTLLSMMPLFSFSTLLVFTSQCAFYLIPFALLLVFRSINRPSVANSIALIITLWVFPFLHPESALFLLVILFCISISYFLARPRKEASHAGRINKRPSLTNPIMILLMGFLAWLTYSLALTGTVRTIYGAIFESNGNSFASVYGSLISISQIQISDLAWLVFVVYGAMFVLIFLALLQLLTSHPIMSLKEKNLREVLFLVVFPVLTAMALTFLLEPLVIDTRPLRYLALVSIILCGLFLHCLTENRIRTVQSIRVRKRSIKRVMMVGLVVILLVASLIGFYPSPNSKNPNYQIDQTDFLSMEFYFDTASSLNSTYSLSLDQTRYAAALFGVESSRIISIPVARLPPPHFNYYNANVKNLLGTNQTSYLQLNQRSFEFYPTIYPEFVKLWKFTSLDFEHLESDQRVSKLYTNGNNNLYQVVD